MKKRAIILPVLIALVLIAMFLPWAYQLRWANAPGVNPDHYYTSANFMGALFTGSLYLGISLILALAAFVFSFFSKKSLVCRILCGVLLLVSAGFCFFESFPKFRCFTVLTWCIFGALVLLGLWTLLFFKRNAKQDA